MVYSGAWGKLIHEKNQKQKISWHCPFKREVTQELFTSHSLVGFDRATRLCARAPVFLGSYIQNTQKKTQDSFAAPLFMIYNDM